MYLLTEEKKQHIAQKRRSGMVGRGEEFIVYGQFHLLYLCSILAEKGKVDISDAMERKKLVDQSICILLEYAEVKKKAAPYSLFRSHKTNEELLSVAILNKQLAFEFQEDLVQKTSQAA